MSTIPPEEFSLEFDDLDEELTAAQKAELEAQKQELAKQEQAKLTCEEQLQNLFSLKKYKEAIIFFHEYINFLDEKHESYINSKIDEAHKIFQKNVINALEQKKFIEAYNACSEVLSICSDYVEAIDLKKNIVKPPKSISLTVNKTTATIVVNVEPHPDHPYIRLYRCEKHLVSLQGDDNDQIALQQAEANIKKVLLLDATTISSIRDENLSKDIEYTYRAESLIFHPTLQTYLVSEEFKNLDRVIFPDSIKNLSYHVGDCLVEANWEVPKSCDEIVITKHSDGLNEGDIIPTNKNSFKDLYVTNNKKYVYRIAIRVNSYVNSALTTIDSAPVEFIASPLYSLYLVDRNYYEASVNQINGHVTIKIYENSPKLKEGILKFLFTTKEFKSNQEVYEDELFESGNVHTFSTDLIKTDLPFLSDSIFLYATPYVVRDKKAMIGESSKLYYMPELKGFQVYTTVNEFQLRWQWPKSVDQVQIKHGQSMNEFQTLNISKEVYQKRGFISIFKSNACKKYVIEASTKHEQYISVPVDYQFNEPIYIRYEVIREPLFLGFGTKKTIIEFTSTSSCSLSIQTIQQGNIIYHCPFPEIQIQANIIYHLNISKSEAIFNDKDPLVFICTQSEETIIFTQNQR